LPFRVAKTPNESFSVWDARYEVVREQWLSGQLTGEAVLVWQQGVLAWMRSIPNGDRSEPPALASGDASTSILVTHSLVLAFAELILNRRPEEPP
jgi:hypothetical protein